MFSETSEVLLLKFCLVSSHLILLKVWSNNLITQYWVQLLYASRLTFEKLSDFYLELYTRICVWGGLRFRDNNLINMFVIELLTAAAEDAASSVLNKKLRSTVHNSGGNSKQISFLILLRKKHCKIETL